jgi:hypothetical protein
LGNNEPNASISVKLFEQFDKLFQSQSVSDMFFEHFYKEIQEFAELQKYFTIIINLERNINNFKINILTTVSVMKNGIRIDLQSYISSIWFLI